MEAVRLFVGGVPDGIASSELGARFKRFGVVSEVFPEKNGRHVRSLACFQYRRAHMHATVYTAYNAVLYMKFCTSMHIQPRCTSIALAVTRTLKSVVVVDVDVVFCT